MPENFRLGKMGFVDRLPCKNFFLIRIAAISDLFQTLQIQALVLKNCKK
jgi:hypothetical protein